MIIFWYILITFTVIVIGETHCIPIFFLANTILPALQKILNVAWNCTVCFTNYDQGSEMVIFESILTTFIASVPVAKVCSRQNDNF
jgi:hypothetical protein